MKLRFGFVLLVVLLLASCATRDLPPNGIVEPEERWFSTSNKQGKNLFDVRSPIGRWRWWDRTKRKGTKYFGYFYEGPNSAMINAEVRISFNASGRPRTLEERKNETRISEQEKWLKSKTTHPNFLSTYKPRNLVAEIRPLASLQCGYFSYENHTGPTLDTPTEKFRGLGSYRKEEWYRCPVMRDDKLWFFRAVIVYQYSDLIAKNNLNIDLQKTIKDFDRMIKPTLDSLKLYGDLKQF